MTFYEYWKRLDITLYDAPHPYDVAKAAWEARQPTIDLLLGANRDLAKEAIIPEGYVLVPVKPTAKMLAIGRKTVQEADIWEVYQAMIQAAQNN